MRARIISMIVLTASLLAVSQAFAQSDGAFTVGAGFWTQTNPEAKYQEYTQLPRGGFLSDYVLREFGGKWASAAWGNTPTRFDQKDAMYLAYGVTWRLDASFNATPHDFSNVAHSPWTQTSTGVFSLSDSLRKVVQSGLQTAANPNQNKTLANMMADAPLVPLGIQTDVTKVRLRGRPIKDWQFEVKGTDRVRNGSQALGATLGGPGGPTVELPAPISQRTIDVDASGTYTHGPARVMASVGVSSFHNDITRIRYDSFKAYTADSSARPSVGQMATAPDNNLVRGRLTASYRLPYASTFTATIGMSQTTQKQDFLPMTVNPVLLAKYANTDQLNLPAGNLDGKVTDVVQDYRLTGRPIADLYGTLRYREESSTDKTPILTLPYGFVNYDQAWSRGAVSNEDFSTKHGVLGFDGDYSFTSKADLSVLAEYRTRSLPDSREVLKDKESVFGVKLKLRPLEATEVDLGWQGGQRRMDAFDVDAYDGGEWPLFRRFDVADRDQNKLEGAISWAANSKLDLSVNGWYSKDNYPNSVYGLQSSTTTQVFGEGTLHAVKNLDLTGGFGYGLIKSNQASLEDPNSPPAGVPLSDTTSLAPWNADLQDKNAYAFAQLNWWAKPKKLQVTLDYTFDRDWQTYDFSHYLKANAAGVVFGNVASTTAIDLPNALYRTNDVVLAARWHYTPQLDLACTYGYTQYDVSDELAQNIPYVNVNPTNVATAASGIFLGTGKLNYTAHRFQVAATRHF